MNGWIKLHRKILNNPITKKPAWAWLWVVLLLLANHDETDSFIWNGAVVHLKKGQFITGRKKLRELTGIPETTIERALDFFEKTGHQIEQQKTTKYRMITILKWNDYQNTDTKPDNRRTTDGQQTDTFKNDKKNKNDKKDTASQDDARIPLVINLFKEVNPSYQRLFGMPPQRSAVSRLLKAHGLEKLEQMIRFLPKSNATRYAPTITTPVQFESRLGELVAWSQKQKDTKSNIQEII